MVALTRRIAERLFHHTVNLAMVLDTIATNRPTWRLAHLVKAFAPTRLWRARRSGRPSLAHCAETALVEHS